MTHTYTIGPKEDRLRHAVRTLRDGDLTPEQVDQLEQDIEEAIGDVLHLMKDRDINATTLLASARKLDKLGSENADLKEEAERWRTLALARMRTILELRGLVNESEPGKEPEGLYGKYIVLRSRDYSDAETVALCLDWRDPVALASILFYAEQTTNEEFASDLIHLVEQKLADPDSYQRIKWTDSYPSEEDLANILEALRGDEDELGQRGEDLVQGLLTKEPSTRPGIDVIVIVSGEPFVAKDAMQFSTFSDLREHVLKETRNTGRPPESWEIRDEGGHPVSPETLIAASLHTQRFFLSLRAGSGGEA